MILLPIKVQGFRGAEIPDTWEIKMYKLRNLLGLFLLNLY